jgi:hypothetical protein
MENFLQNLKKAAKRHFVFSAKQKNRIRKKLNERLKHDIDSEKIEDTSSKK